MADDPRTVANDPRAPAQERADALAQLEAVYRPLASELLPTGAVRQVMDYVQDQMEEAAMAKASRANVIRFPARNEPVPTSGMRSVRLDNMQLQVSSQYYERPGAISFDALRQMVAQTPILSAIVMTRVRQVTAFCQPSEDGGLGFEIRHVDRKHELQPDEAESCALLAKFFQNCGWEFNPRARKKLRRDSFTSFVSKLVRDTLTMDACPIETEMKRNAAHGIDGLYAVDGTTIRLVTEQGYDGDDSIYALQVVQGRIATTYTMDQLIYEVRNPRTDVDLAGYGLGEPELMIRVVTGILNAMTYNSDGFDKNSIPRGIMQLTGDYAPEDLAGFRRQWNAMVRGVNNSWSLPLLVNKDGEGKAEFTQFGEPFNEMAFAKWMTFLTSIATAIYGMAPDEINFESFSAQKSSLSGSDTTEKLADSKDKGLRPLMAFLESTLTDYVVSAFGPKYCFRWVGLDEKDLAQEWEAKKLILTVDELRAEKGYEPWKGDSGIGDAPLNPSLIGPWQQANQPAQQGQEFGGGPGGDYGDEQGGGEDDGAGDGQPQPGTDQAPDAQGANDGGGAPAGPPGGDFGTGSGGGDDEITKALTTIYAIGGAL